MKSKGKVITITVLAIILFIIVGSVIWYFNTGVGGRAFKTWISNNSGGLNRTVQVYDQGGHLIKEYEGKIDVQDTEYGNKILFELNGKRTIIYNGTVIIQEK